MADDNTKERQNSYLNARIKYLEKANQETLEALSQVAKLGNFRTSLNQLSSVDIILKKADTRLRELFEFGATAFYVFNEDGMDLSPVYISDEQARPTLDQHFQLLVDQLHVAKCVNGTKPVFANVGVSNSVCMLHPLATSSRLRGLFVGELKANRAHIPDSLFSVFSVIMGNTANMLESFELYGMIRTMNEELAEQVEKLEANRVTLETEITRRRETESDLRDSQEMLEKVMSNIPQFIFWKDTNSVYMGCNMNFAKAAGCEHPEQVVGLTDHDMPWVGDEADFFRQIDQEVMKGDLPVLSLVESITMQDGIERYVETNKVPLRDQTGEIIGVLGTFHDITAQKAYEERLSHQAFHDSLTGLPNRALITERIDRALRRAERNKEERFAVMLLDLDRFKYINDSLGHLAGDRLLVEVGQRLEDTLRSVDTVARLGGDEFALLVEGFDSPREVVIILRRIMKALHKPFEIHTSTIHSTISIGVVLFPENYHSPEDVLRDADVAMYHAKNRGGARFKVYADSMRDTVLKTATLHNDLLTGITNNEFVLEYQPIYDISASTLKGVEALVRWDHPVKGRLRPDEFIPIAEDTGLIVDLGKHLLDKACVQAAKWNKMTDNPFYVSVNISAKQLRSPSFAGKVQDILDKCGLPPDCLALEMTETILMDRAETTLGILRNIKELGIRLFLDDFGTGYSSLSYLQQFPVDTIKIDRCFVKNLGNGVNEDGDGDGTAIVTAVMALAQSLGMRVIAEGVEEKQQLDVLEHLQCGMVQGFYYAKPQPPEAIDKLISK